MKAYRRFRAHHTIPWFVFVAVSVSLFYGYVEYRSSTYVSVPPYTRMQMLGAYEEHGVHVQFTLERDRNNTLVLASTYTPDDSTSHVYSREFPPAGIAGVGRPTLLEVLHQPSVRTIGSVRADQPVLFQQVEGFKTAFPIYPDGAVTLRQPIRVTTAAGRIPLDVRITYMACSSRGYCMPPVVDKRLVLSILAEYLQ